MNPYKTAAEKIRRIIDDTDSIYQSQPSDLIFRETPPEKVNRHDPATWTTRQLLRTFVWGDESRYHERVKELLEDRGISVDELDDEIERLLDRIEVDASQKEAATCQKI